jgi:hypothetical protein
MSICAGPELSIYREWQKASKRADKTLLENRCWALNRKRARKAGEPPRRSQVAITMRQNAAMRAKRMKITLPHISIQDGPL